MHLRRFEAGDISTAIEKVKAELGSDAIILSTDRKQKKDPLTNRVTSYVEVVAAIDRDNGGRVDGSPRTREEAERGDAVHDPYPELAKQMEDIRKALSNVTDFVSQALTRDLYHRGAGTFAISNSCLEIVYDVLSRLSLDRRTEQHLCSRIFASLDREIVTRDQVISWLRDHVAASFTPGPRAEELGQPCWWAFIGPTGVGKTTTLAKIAARLKFLHKRQGVLVSVDGYRLGAAEQLRGYAALMDLPLETAKTNKELVRIFSRHRDKDFILVDTTGRNPFSSSHHTELQRIFDAVPGLMAQVMLCATYKREDTMESIGFYRQFPVAGWTITKTDETRSLGTFLLPVLETGIPISYVTDGQRVPEDIRAADGESLFQEVMKANLQVNTISMEHEIQAEARIC